MSEWVKQLIISGTTGTSLLIIAIIYLFKNPDKFEHWMAIFYRMFHSVTFIFPKIRQKVDRHAVATSIQDSVNGTCERINRQSPDILPHALKIQWVRSESPESFIKKGQVVVRLKHYVNQDRNIVGTTLLYLKLGLLPRAKNYLDKTLRKSCEFKVAVHVFVARRDTGAYDYFLENELDPEINTNANFKQDLQMLEDLDSVGFFTHVFLTEVKQTGEKLLGTMPTPAIQQELRSVASFLQTIANKGSDEDVPLTFKGVKVKMAVILVARKETIKSYGIAPYINRISCCAQEGYESIYVSGWGEEFVRRIIEIKREMEGKFITVLRRYDYPIREQIKGILLVCQSNLSYLAQQRELQEEVKQAMAEIVPEIKNGEIEIVSIARIRGVGCKIAVRMTSGDDVFEATGACIGENGERVNALRLRLPNEFLAIVPWSTDIKEFVVNALTPLKAHYVDTVEIDEENLIANIKVISDHQFKKALGKNNCNAELASDLVGWVINIEGPEKIKTMNTPDEELKEIISAHVPEIKNDEIEIVGIARIKRIGSRIIVKWKNKDAESKKLMASQVCRGHNNERAKKIQEETMREWIYFHEWYDDTREQIISCLYPLKNTDVDSIDLDDNSNIAIVTLREKIESSPTWRDQYRLNISERVTGWRIEIREKT